MTRNPYEIAERDQCSLAEAKAALALITEPTLGWGKVSLYPHIISRRHVGANWPASDQLVLRHHQKLHDQGRVNMCQGRDGMYIIQYAIPNEKIVKRTAYFGGLAC